MKQRIIKIAIDRIKIPHNRKTRGDPDDLANSILKQGLIYPIIVSSSKVLIVGYHRLLAYKLLAKKYKRFKFIPCRVVKVSKTKARLMEIDENLVRNELTELQKGIQLFERKQIYESLGGDSGETFTVRASRLSGESRRVIERYCQIGRELHVHEDRIERLSIADNKGELIRLASIKDIAVLETVLDLLHQGKAFNVKDARRIFEMQQGVSLLGYPIIPDEKTDLSITQFNFQLSHAQKALVERALELARSEKLPVAVRAKNSNANNLAKICHHYVSQRLGQQK